MKICLGKHRFLSLAGKWFSFVSAVLVLEAVYSIKAADTSFDSLAFGPDTGPGPTVTLPEHPSLNWTRVAFHPQRTNDFPEELKPMQVFQAPAGQISGLALAGEVLWVGSLATRRVYRLDARTGAVRGEFACPGNSPAGMFWDGRILWQADRSAKALFGLDEAGKVLQRFELNFEPSAVVRLSGDLLVSDWGRDEFRRLNPDSGALSGSEPAPGDQLTGLTRAGRHLWCARGNEIICFDRQKGLPVCGFNGVPGENDAKGVNGLTADGDSFWYANGNRLMRVRIPKNGEWVVGGARVRRTGFEIVYHNRSEKTVEEFSVLQHIPFLEMPGQRYLSLQVQPEPQALFRDDLGNVIALIRFGDLPAGQSVRCQIGARMWVGDRRMIVDPNLIGMDSFSAARRAYATRFHPIAGEDSPEVKEFVDQAVGGETNAYWRVRKVHDALCRRIYYREPEDESVPGVLRQGYGVCRNYSAAMESFGRLLGIPILNAWAPRHETCFLMLTGVGPAVMEVTADDSGPDPASPWRRSRWFLGTSANEITTGVRGYAMHSRVLVDDVPYVYRWHYWVPSKMHGISQEGWWTITDPQTGKVRRL